MCYKSPQGAEVGHFYTDFSDQLPTKRTSPSYTGVEVDMTDGRLSCRVTRPLKVKKNEILYVK